MSQPIFSKGADTASFEETDSPAAAMFSPLSRGQRAMWFLWSLHRDGAEYGLPMAWTICSVLDARALRDALQDLVDRHPALRTTYAVRHGEPVQRIHARSQVHFRQVDASGWSAEELHVRLTEEAHQPFDLEHGPLFKVSLFTCGDSRHVLLFNTHHIMSDTWTLIIMMEELGILYGSRLSGATPELPSLGLSYTNFIAWQQEMLDGPQGEAHWDYWRGQLAAPPVLDLPTDRPRPPVQTHAGAGYAFELDSALTQRFRTLAKQENVTLYTVLLAAFYALLYRYTGQEDLVVGSPRFGRPPEGYERTVGYFASPCALRTQVDGAMTFAQFLARVRQVLVGAKEHQDFPFPLLVERLGLQRDLSRSPVFQVAFTYQKSHLAHMQGVAAARMGFGGANLDLSGLALASYPLEQRSVKFDLDFVVEEVNGSLRAVCWYNTELWNHETVGFFAEHYQTLLTSAVQDPQQTLDRLPILTPREQAAYAQWNATDAPLPQANAHQLFETRAAQTPQAEALVYGGQALSYAELNRRANQLAHYLLGHGVQQGQLVGLSVERGPEMVIGVIAILKAGGAYLPLDPAYPQERLAYMAEDAGLTLLLTQSSLVGQLPAEGVQTICFDTDWPAIAQESGNNPNRAGSHSDLAYVIYTSGSTGRPKGVLLEHRGLTNLVQAQIEAFAIESSSRILQFASFSFDASVSEIFTALCAGAALCLASKPEMIPGSALVRTLTDNRITVVTLPPSVLALLEPRDVPALKTVVTAGEACSLELARRWSSGRRFLNAYGPTEATVCATIAQVQPDTERVTIGGPIANTKIYVLDSSLQPAPVGIAGEVYIAGVGLARGYLGRPDLTEERFVPNPSGLSGERMYKTGDLGRWLPDGTLEFLGRLDHQVKLRGFRIELGELESVIAEHPGVREALVVPREEKSGGQRLVAYVIPHQAGAVAAAALRTHMQSKLPDFMVPAAFVFLAAWPLTPNGKIDRRALPAPLEGKAQGSAALPKDPLERQIAAIWRDVLGLDAVGVDDNFFEVGGHSLSIVRVEAQLKEELGLTVPTMDLFRFPTIRALASHLRPSAADRGGRPEAATNVSTALLVDPAGRAETEFAIVGMAGRFPGADNIDELWRNLAAGVESVKDLTDDELLAAGVDPSLLQDSRYVKRKGVLNGIELFDAAFFGFTPREARLMDPQHRLFLEVGWQALEHAGYDSQTYTGRIGVYGGTGRPGYLLYHLNTNPEAASELFQTNILNEKDFLSTRLAYKLNLRGPALSVQTACSTSLVAVHLACQQLQLGECDVALAGGVSIEVPHGTGYLYQQGHIMSPDGRCRAFDAEAQGTIRGSGGAVVVLKRLSDAVAQGDNIWAVIKGSAINNDGSMKVGYTAPSVDGQAEVIEQALRRAGVNPRTIGFVEAHGTGTPLGDPIEVAALTQTYRNYTEDREYCFLGSAKTNVGHLDAAAGVTGLIKAALAVHHGVIPPTLHFGSPNPKLALAQSPFVVNNRAVTWEPAAFPRRAAVSSFGIGGTNAHVILEQAPTKRPASIARRTQVLALSAKSERALTAMTENLANALQDCPDADLADIAFTLQTGRAQLAHRRIVVSDSVAGAVESLRTLPQRHAHTGKAAGGETRVTFIFPGQGLQKVNMGRELYETEPAFRECVDWCAELLQPLLGLDLRRILYPLPEETEQASKQLAQTAITQPALFVVEYALARLLMAWGVQPQAMMGHSLGEYVAACLAGVMTLPEALELVAVRGKLVQQLPGGVMVAVESSPEQLEPFLGEGVDLAVVNGPRACVLAGDAARMEAVQERLTASGLRWKAVQTSHAFHSAMLDPILNAFRAEVNRVALQPPMLPYITNVTGTWVTREQAIDADHWVRHMRQTVHFAAGFDELLSEPGGIYLEVGPGQAFTSSIQRHPNKQNLVCAAPTLAAGQETSDCAALFLALGRLWTVGVSPDWPALHGQGARRRVALPVYPFDRKRYWLEARPASPAGAWVSEAAAASDTDEVDADEQAERRSEHAAIRPRDELELELVRIFEDVLGLTPIGVNENFFDLGGSSLSALSVTIRLEQIVGGSVSNGVLFESPTVEMLAQAIRSGISSHNSRLVGIQTAGELPPIFCIHPYGGHTTGYFELARFLGANQPVYGIQASGLQGEAEPYTRIEEMAADYIRLLQSKQPSGPYTLVGHSMGGCIAYEMAQQLRRADEEVALLALLDSRAHNFSIQPLYRNGGYGLMARKDWLSDDVVILGILLPKLSMDWELLHEVTAEEQWRLAVQAAIGQGLLPPGTGEEKLRHLLAVTRANDEALRTYAPQAYDDRVLLVCGEDGFAKQFGEPELGWRELVGAGLDVVHVAGDHHSIMVGASAEAIARYLQERGRTAGRRQVGSPELL